MEGSGLIKGNDLDGTTAIEDKDEMNGRRHRWRNKIGCSATLFNSAQLTTDCRKEGAIFQ